MIIKKVFLFFSPLFFTCNLAYSGQEFQGNDESANHTKSTEKLIKLEIEDCFSKVREAHKIIDQHLEGKSQSIENLREINLNLFESLKHLAKIDVYNLSKTEIETFQEFYLRLVSMLARLENFECLLSQSEKIKIK